MTDSHSCEAINQPVRGAADVADGFPKSTHKDTKPRKSTHKDKARKHPQGQIEKAPTYYPVRN